MDEHEVDYFIAKGLIELLQENRDGLSGKQVAYALGIAMGLREGTKTPTYKVDERGEPVEREVQFYAPYP